jgi:hypothetical protein
LSPAFVSGLMFACAENPVHSILFPIPVFCNTYGLLLLYKLKGLHKRADQFLGDEELIRLQFGNKFDFSSGKQPVHSFSEPKKQSNLNN